MLMKALGKLRAVLAGICLGSSLPWCLALLYKNMWRRTGRGFCLWTPVGARKITVTCYRSEHPSDRTPEAKIVSSISVWSRLRAMSSLSQVFYFSQKKNHIKSASCMCLAGSTGVFWWNTPLLGRLWQQTSIETDLWNLLYMVCHD